MKNFLFAAVFSFSMIAFAQDTTLTAPPANPSTPDKADADVKGTIVPPTQKQLKSVKKPSAKPAVQPATTTPEKAPSH